MSRHSQALSVKRIVYTYVNEGSAALALSWYKRQNGSGGVFLHLAHPRTMQLTRSLFVFSALSFLTFTAAAPRPAAVLEKRVPKVAHG